MTKRNLHILFDANPLVGNKSGIGHFSERFLASLAASDKDMRVTAYYFNFLGRKKVSGLPNHKNITYKVVRFCPTKLLSMLNILHIRLPIELFVGLRRFDFAIYPNFVSMLSVRRTPNMVAVHDLGFLDCPQYVQEGNRRYLERSVPSSVARSTYILTISEFTKSRIAHYYGKSAQDKTIVVPIPYEPIDASGGSVSELVHSLVKKPYILYVGTIEPRKNIDNLLLGFVKSNARKTHKLVLAGAMGWKTGKIEQVLKSVRDKADIVTTGYINDTERNELYKNAAAVCLISHYEGFGMTVLEAAHYKKPMLLSSIGVLREVAAPGAIFCEPDSVPSIAAGIDKAASSPSPSEYHGSVSWGQNIDTIMSRIKESLHE